MSAEKSEKKIVRNCGFLDYCLDQLDRVVEMGKAYSRKGQERVDCDVISTEKKDEWSQLLTQINPKLRRKIEHALWAKDQETVLAVATILNSVYNNDELLPNTNKNQLTQTKRKMKPFKLSSRYIYGFGTAKPLLIEWIQKGKSLKKTLRKEKPTLITRLREGQDLPDAWNDLVKRQPQEILKGLKHVWSSRGTKAIQGDSIKRMLQATDATQLCHTRLPRKCRLDETYLPFPHLREQCAQFMEQDEAFPFLKLEKVSDVDEINPWLFLHTELGVKKHDNIEFLLDILKWIKISNSQSGCIKNPSRILRLYSAINSKFVAAECSSELKERIKSFFQREAYILAFDSVSSGSHTASWLYPRDCMWQGPENMMRKRPLEPTCQSLINKSQALCISIFFSQVLDIRSISWFELISELVLQKEQSSYNFAVVSGFYKYLRHMNDLPIEATKRVFQDESLILATKDSQPGWYKPSECLWSSTTEQPGKVILRGYREELKEFFINSLGVQSLTIQTVYNDLLENNAKVEIGEIKSKIRSLNELLCTEHDYIDPEPLMQRPIFPVVYPCGTKALQPASTEFAIVDRENLASYFRGAIKLLDFSQEEVRGLGAFFEWTGLSSRHLSVSVKMASSIISETRPWNPPPTRCDFNFKDKAHAILRVAGTFNSPRYQEDKLKLFKVLQNATIRVTDNFFTTLCITQDGWVTKVANVKENGRKIHVDEGETGLNVCIFDDIGEEELGFFYFLPEKLAEWLMKDSLLRTNDRADMVRLLMIILSVDSSRIDELLDTEGVMEVDIPNNQKSLDGVRENDIIQQPTVEEYLSSHLPQPTYGYTGYYSPLQDVQPPCPIPNHSIEKIDMNSPSSKHTSLFRRHLECGEFSLAENLEDSWYTDLLNRVVRIAQLTNFPSRWDLSTNTRKDLHLRNSKCNKYEGSDRVGVTKSFNASANNSESQSESRRYHKVGAAGELYVFELLANSFLPKWGYDNWPSTIRHYVKMHRDHANMKPWKGAETADIVYEDTVGAFTALLIQNGYLNPQEWMNRRPKYFIEVKTTTGPPQVPFYMSRHQFKEMGEMHRENAASDYSEVYMICRVFFVNGPDIGMRVYVDPEQLRHSGELQFKFDAHADNWSVAPR